MSAPDVTMTYTLDGGDSRPVTSHQNLTTCSGVPVELSVCVPTARPGSLLSLKVKGQTILSSQSCVRVIERFSSSQAVVFSYDGEEFIFNMMVVAPCVSRKRRSWTWRSRSPATSWISGGPPPVALRNTTSSTTCGNLHPVTLNIGIEILHRNCDTATQGSEWITIQRRTVGDVDFYRGWGQYINGFGDPTRDHWLGLENIHTLCPPSRPCILRVELKDPDYLNGTLVWAEYSSFSLSGYFYHYRLSVSGYDSRSTAGDGLEDYNGMYFSTKDKDNDRDPGENCAVEYHGAWWYSLYCSYSNLNGKYGVRDDKGLQWYWCCTSSKATILYPTYTEMKIRVLG